jgi:phage terminase Nu1 subunit (DNA packaging protein)
MANDLLPETMDAATLAALLGLTANRVNALAREGAIPRAGRGRFPIPDAVQAYVAWAKANPAGRRVADADLADEKKRLAREQADKIALQNARARGDLLDAHAVRSRWGEYTTRLRSALLAVPARVTAQVGLDRAGAAALDAEVRAALDQIATEGASNAA